VGRWIKAADSIILTSTEASRWNCNIIIARKHNKWPSLFASTYNVAQSCPWVHFHRFSPNPTHQITDPT